MAKLSHTCTKFAEKLELMKVSIHRAVITRWNSQFLLVERILEKNNVQYTTSLCNALLPSWVFRFGGLLEGMNKKFYDLYQVSVFIFSPFLYGMFKSNWINDSPLPNPFLLSIPIFFQHAE